MDVPLRAGEYFSFDDGWIVNGTPADCVKLAINCLLKEKTDLIIAGINRGPNLGIDVFTLVQYQELWKGTILGFLLLLFQLQVLRTEIRLCS